ncbi:hypothetical protein B0H63DRAFT_172386 [Podospora didyma]|uniref:Uncharacterized protein n=1 Tax=Podospora didyma TaxID=330526 RepID=A0AAE0NNM2_9PEZI|nr:hypothetical protein B0H63DRAFT_172386 [Podospora didyma]
MGLVKSEERCNDLWYGGPWPCPWYYSRCTFHGRGTGRASNKVRGEGKARHPDNGAARRGEDKDIVKYVRRIQFVPVLGIYCPLTLLVLGDEVTRQAGWRYRYGLALPLLQLGGDNETGRRFDLWFCFYPDFRKSGRKFIYLPVETTTSGPIDYGSLYVICRVRPRRECR